MLFCFVSTAFAGAESSFQAVLSRHASGGRVDYAALKNDDGLDGFVGDLGTATVPQDRNAKMAFWINAYNALTIDLVADNWPLKSIRDLDGGNPWDTRKFNVAGQMVTLNHIEHKVLRPMGDPRIHAAVNCASIGCPPLPATAFVPSRLDQQLDQASRHWMKTNGVRIADGSVTFNQIFDWYGDDFVAISEADIPGVGGKAEAAANFAAKYVSEADATRLRAGGYTTDWHAYDWGVNAR